MAKNAKIDWDSLKIQYYKSEIIEVKIFLKSIWRNWSWNTYKKTLGWVRDKEKFMENINDKATKEVSQSLIDQRGILLSNMEKAKIKWLNELATRLNNNVAAMNVWTIWAIVSIFNSEQEKDSEKVDNTGSIISLREKIKAAQVKKLARKKKT